MNMNKQLISATATAALSAAGAAQAGVIATLNFVPNADFAGSLNHASEVPNGTVFSSTGAGNAPISYGIDGGLGTGRGSFDPFTLTETVDGVTFTGTYTLSFVLTSSTESDGDVIERGGVGALGVVGGGGLQAGETLTVSDVVLTNVTGDDDFNFLGFSGAYFGSTNGSEDNSINGVVVTAIDAANFLVDEQLISFDGVEGVASLLTDLTIGGASGTTTLNGLQASFSVVPEPASMALIGLGSLALMSRRRKA